MTMAEFTEPSPHTNTDRKSTRLNSSHVRISYAVFCLKKKNGSHLFVLRMHRRTRRFALLRRGRRLHQRLNNRFLPAAARAGDFEARSRGFPPWVAVLN